MTTALRERDALLARLDSAREALQTAGTLEDVKRIRDSAEAIGLLIARQRMGFAAQQDAAALRLRAERRLGSMLPDIITNGGAPESHSVTLDSLGIGRMQSLRWQRSATVPEKAFEAYLEACRDHGREITQAAILRLAVANAETAQTEWDAETEFPKLIESHIRRLNEELKAFRWLEKEPEAEKWDMAGVIGHLQAARDILERGRSKAH